MRFLDRVIFPHFILNANTDAIEVNLDELSCSLLAGSTLFRDKPIDTKALPGCNNMPPSSEVNSYNKI